MRELFFGFLDGIEEIQRWRTTTLIVLFAALSFVTAAAAWYLFGAQLMGLSNTLVQWLPFSMLRSNGAWMLSIFLWLQAIMLTVALLSLLLTLTLYRNLPKSDFTPAVGWLLAGATLFWSVVWYFKGSMIYNEVLHLLTVLPFDTVENGVSFLLIFYFLYNIMVVVTFVLSSLYAPVFLRRARFDVCPDADLRSHARFQAIGYTFRDIGIFAGASLLLMPLLFVPVVNVLVQLLLWAWLVKETLTFDVGTLLYEADELKAFKRKNRTLWSIALVTALFNFFPLLNFAGPFVGQIMMLRYFSHVRPTA